MVWLTLGSCLLMSWQNGYLDEDLFNHNVRCSYIISMHEMDLKVVLYLMLMILTIGIQMKILENGLLIPWEGDYMWNYWDMHIGSCQ